MIIAGLQKLSLLDYPGKTACTLFISGCNFRCPFCHNPDLVRGTNLEAISENEVLTFLRKRCRVLEGVCVSGGEPLLDNALPGLLKKIKALGFSIKLDTNGSSPEKLQRLIDSEIVDYVAMDIKNSPEKYAKSCGIHDLDLNSIQQSVDLLLKERVAYEFRTTIVKELHDEQDLIRIGNWIHSAEHYYLQFYRDSENVLMRGFHAFSDDQMEQALSKVKEILPAAELRRA